MNLKLPEYGFWTLTTTSQKEIWKSKTIIFCVLGGEPICRTPLYDCHASEGCASIIREKLTSIHGPHLVPILAWPLLRLPSVIRVHRRDKCEPFYEQIQTRQIWAWEYEVLCRFTKFFAWNLSIEFVRRAWLINAVPSYASFIMLAKHADPTRGRDFKIGYNFTSNFCVKIDENRRRKGRISQKTIYHVPMFAISPLFKCAGSL